MLSIFCTNHQAKTKLVTYKYVRNKANFANAA